MIGKILFGKVLISGYQVTAINQADQVVFKQGEIDSNYC
jgi:hypothetical protein